MISVIPGRFARLRQRILWAADLFRQLTTRAACALLPQTEVLQAAEFFARTEGILPAPESAHAIKAAINEAVSCRETGEEKTILFGLTGTGYFDMAAYEKLHDGRLEDYIPTDEQLKKYFDNLPQIS